MTDVENPKYHPPVDKLLTYGDCRKVRKFPNYVEKLGFSAEHIPDLIRMATDPDLNWGDSDSLEVWAPVHASRALGQLKAEAAIEPLLSIAEEMEVGDSLNEELPQIFALIGPAAIPALKTFLADTEHTLYPRINVGQCLVKIAQAHPDTRTECVNILTHQLEQFTKNGRDLNGFLIADLLDLNAVEAAPVIEQAFAAKRVELDIAGDWLDIQVELGLKSGAEVRQLRYSVDAESLGQKAAKPISEPPRGFASVQNKSTKKGKKK